MLFEREDQLGVVSRALKFGAEGAGSVVVISGPLGNGKTALLRAVATLPEAGGYRVLWATGVPSERDFAFGVVRQLLGPVLARAGDDVWRGRAALARPVFTANGSDQAPGVVDLVRAVRFGVWSLAVDLAGSDPTLVLVDDLQWVDEVSARLLADLAGHASSWPVVFVATVREGEPHADRSAVSAIVSADGDRLRPGPLSPHGSLALMRDRLGTECDDEFGLACHDATGGNPMFLTALALDWKLSGHPPVAAEAGAVRALRPGHSRDRLVTCLRAQPDSVQALAKALVVLVDCDDGRLAGVLAGLDETTTTEALEALHELGLVAGDGFVHPMVRDAVETMVSTAEREGAHVRAVRLLRDRGSPPGRIATQLLGITAVQGEWAVGVLRIAADTALRGGANEVAARYLRRALLETSVDGEDRAEVLVDLAMAERGFDINAAVRHISYATALLSRPSDRAAAAIRLAPTVMGDVPGPIAEMLRRIGDDLGDPDRLEGVDRDLALRVEARLRHIGRTDPFELSEALTRLAGLGPEPGMATGSDRELLTVLLHCAMLSGRRPAAELARLAEEVLSHEPATQAHAHTAMPLLVSVLAAADSPDVVTGRLAEAFESARSRGDAVEQAMIRTGQSLVFLQSGRPAEARRAASDACGMGALNWATSGSATAVVSGAVALQLRDPVLTERLLAAFGDQPRDGCLGAVIGLLRGSHAVLCGDLAGAASLLLECGAQLDRSGWRNPVLFPWRTSVALIKHRLGDTDSALALAEEERLIAQEWGAPTGIGRAWRVLGELSGRRNGVELSQRAVEALAGAGNRLELAKALRQWAEMSARGDVWRRCLEVAVECGAIAIADHARQALGHQPVAPRLTPAERRVAVRAVGGRSNQEIADELSVTSRAVEKHLTNTYRKLGVRGRAELASAMRKIAGE